MTVSQIQRTLWEREQEKKKRAEHQRRMDERATRSVGEEPIEQDNTEEVALEGEDMQRGRTRMCKGYESIFNCYLDHMIGHNTHQSARWPSGLRRTVQVNLSIRTSYRSFRVMKMAWVRIPPLSINLLLFFCIVQINYLSIKLIQKSSNCYRSVRP